MTKRTIKAGLAQCVLGGDRDQNLKLLTEAVMDLAKKQAQLIVLPELHNSHYFCQTESNDNFSLAETIPGPTTDYFSKMAADNKVVIVASVFEKRASGLYHNTAVVLDSDGSLAGTYRKMHIPDDPGYYEKFYFTPGDQGFIPVETSLGKLGVMICWDQWYPEAARLMTLNGADLLIYPTAIGWDPRDSVDEKQRQLDSWLTIQRSHAVANGLSVISCNRTGFEPDPSEQTQGIDFWGNSFISGPQGEFLLQAPADKPYAEVVNIDMERTESVRHIWPFLRDRRVDAYGELTKLFGK